MKLSLFGQLKLQPCIRVLKLKSFTMVSVNFGSSSFVLTSPARTLELYFLPANILFILWSSFALMQPQPARKTISVLQRNHKPTKNSPPPSQPSPSVLARFRILAQGRDLREAPCWQSFKYDGYVIYSVYEVFIIAKREHSTEKRNYKYCFYDDGQFNNDGLPGKAFLLAENQVC